VQDKANKQKTPKQEKAQNLLESPTNQTEPKPQKPENHPKHLKEKKTKQHKNQKHKPQFEKRPKGKLPILII
jgi:hypothetical protein